MYVLGMLAKSAQRVALSNGQVKAASKTAATSPTIQLVYTSVQPPCKRLSHSTPLTSAAPHTQATDQPRCQDQAEQGYRK